MLTLLKDIFWQDQYRPQTESPSSANIGQKLDRDRYFIGLSLLSAFFFISLYGSQFLYPSYDAYFMNDGYRMFNLQMNAFSPNMMLDPVTLVLTIMLTGRAFGRWLALPIGLVTFGILSLVSMGPYIEHLELDHRELRDSLLVMLIISLVWLVFQLVMLARPALKNVQPHHPLVRLNPAFPADKQYTGIQYMWRFVMLGLTMLIAWFVIFALIYIFGGYLDKTPVYIAMAILGIAAILFTILILVKRLRNLGKKPLPWVLALVLIPTAYTGLQAYLYSEDYFDLLPLFALMSVLVAVMRLTILLVQGWLLIGSGQNASSDTEEDAAQEAYTEY